MEKAAPSDAELLGMDREAILLPFYRSLTIREIAATLGIATDAAQKRIDRATERLRGKLLRRGLQTGGSRLREALPLPSAFELWAKKDLVKAIAWLDARIAAGNLDNKRLDDADDRQQSRNAFEFGSIDVLQASDPAAAARRLSAIPEKQRESVMSSLANRMSNWVLNEPLTEGNHLAFANLVRSQLPVNLQVPMLADCVPYFWGVEEIPKFNAYMDVIEATPEERISGAEAFAENRIRTVGGRLDVTLADLMASMLAANGSPAPIRLRRNLIVSVAN